MVGGSSGSSTGAPYDLMGGSGASFSGGTPSGINWAGVGQDVGQGLQQGARVYGSMAQSPVPQFSVPNMPYQSYGTGVQTQQSAIPQTDPFQMQALQRLLQLLGGGGY